MINSSRSLIGGGGSAPLPKDVKRFHDSSDVDSAKNAQHHTLGWGANQAVAGADLKKILNALSPVGDMKIWFKNTPPDENWLNCDFSLFDVDLYPELYAFLGTNRTPNLANRFMYVAGPGNLVGSFGGANQTTIAAANLPPHVHTMNHDHFLNFGSGGAASGDRVSYQPSTTTFIGADTDPIGDFTGNTGNGPGTSTPMNTVPSFFTVNVVIRAIPVLR